MINPKGRLSDEDFLTRFLSDYESLEKLGWKKGQILQALCSTQQYILDWIMTPNWLEAVDKLPKGAKWSNGKKYQDKATHKSDSHTFVLLVYDKDLYFKDLLNYMTTFFWEDKDGNYLNSWVASTMDDKNACYFKKANHTICVIRNFLSIPSMEVVDGFRKGRVLTSILQTAILETWHNNGGRIWGKDSYMTRDLLEG